jgi:DNA-binding transcriptional LysR family regulator
MAELNDLRVFIETARLGSLTRAARHLGRTPAATSASLKRLESDLGVRLVERNTRSLRLTPAGMLYRERVVPGLSLLDAAERALFEEREEIAGEVRLAAPVDLARQWLSPVLTKFHEQHPRVHVTLLVGDAVHDLVSEPIDLAIRYGQLPNSALVARRLLDTRRVLVGTPKYFARMGRPTHPEELVTHNCLTYQSGGAAHRRWSFRRRRETVVVEVSGNRTSNDGSLVREWTLEGLGLSYKSEFDVRRDLETGRLELALEDWRGESTPLNLVFPSVGPRPLRIRKLVEFLNKYLTG